MSLSVADRLDIQQLFGRYSRGLDLQQRDEFLATFWDDGLLISPLLGGDFARAEGLMAFYDAVNDDSPDTEHYRGGQHWTATPVFGATTPASAEVWTHFAFITHGNTGHPRIAMYGDYHDIVTKRAEEWRFSRRQIDITAPRPDVAPSS